MKHFKSLLAAGVIATIPLSANALGFTVTQFDRTALGASQTDYNSIKASRFDSIFATEDFEDFTDPGQIGLGQIGTDDTASLSTAVGSFTTLGGKGSGSTAVDVNNQKVDNATRGLNLSIRQNGDGIDQGGRQNTSDGVGDKNYLDSNDTNGIKWVASAAGGTEFNRLLFTLTDPTDQGKKLTISANGFSETFTIAPREPNGEIFNVLIGFSDKVSSATISMAKNGVNDGFSFDNATIGAVPLPAAAWLLLGVSGALVAAKRRSARRAA
jgi:hypothetical protein